MTDYEKSAIIGYIRSGARLMEMYYLTGIHPDTINKLIKEYRTHVPTDVEKTIPDQIKVRQSDKKL